MVHTLYNTGANSISILGNVIKEIQELMKNFHQCCIQHVGRMENEGAHKLAKHAWNIDGISVWEGSYSEFISSVIWIDKH